MVKAVTIPFIVVAVAVAVWASGFPIVTRGAVVYPLPALRIVNTFVKLKEAFGLDPITSAVNFVPYTNSPNLKLPPADRIASAVALVPVPVIVTVGAVVVYPLPGLDIAIEATDPFVIVGTIFVGGTAPAKVLNETVVPAPYPDPAELT